MTGAELREILLSEEFKQDLVELSSYLAGIAQERPIINLLAKCLWRRAKKFDLEDQRRDLFVGQKRFEFKFNYDRCQEVLEAELEKHGDNLKKMWKLRKGNWGVLQKIYDDVCVKMPDIFVWIICSRDLSRVLPDDLKRICRWREQCKYNIKHPYTSVCDLTVADSLLSKLQAIRRFSVLEVAVPTNGDFRSTYYFKICEFASLKC